ncbi:hypothetical protein PINS_up007245 [Pythium insidiosum]|nr:hypothetical protein PINS_up007245 [Pythium insidiosum]
MDDDDIYAYEQELQEMDEWEAMHAHEIEAAEEELRAMEAAEMATRERRDSAPAPQPSDGDDDDEVMQQSLTERNESYERPMTIEERLAATEARVRSALERCATALGEDDQNIEETERFEDYVTRKELVAKVDTTTATFLLSRPPIEVPSVSVVLSTGERRFVRKREKSIFTSSVTSRFSASDKPEWKTLLPISEMMIALEQRQIEAAAHDDGKVKGSTITRRPQMVYRVQCSLVGQVQARAVH